MDDPDRVALVLVAPGPNIIAPRHSGLTWTPVRPSGRYCMEGSPFLHGVQSLPEGTTVPVVVQLASRFSALERPDEMARILLDAA